MSFKFNFGCSDDTAVDANNTDAVKNSKENRDHKIVEYRPCKIHKTSAYALKAFSDQAFSSIELSGQKLYYINHDVVSEGVQDSKISCFLDSTDLQTGEYEGGLKVWECTYDLLQYLGNNTELMKRSKRVMDLGCGAGLLGVYAFLNGSEHVCLQDYNSEVVENFTLPTVQKNISINDSTNKNGGDCHSDNNSLDKFEFISGDWGNISEQFVASSHEQFDLILSSETIYNSKYYTKIRDFLHEHMSDNSVALFAAKTHYFGVGGGTREFVRFLSENNTFRTETVLNVESGVSREILKICKTR